MNVDHELPIVFDCEGQELIGVIHNADANTHIGVLIVVGGPQYRVGSHRQFVLLARYLAKAGIPIMRFDYRGMGDSPGNTRDFNHIGKDIASAINTLQMYNKAVQKIVIWGLCDAASAALFYAYEDERVTGLVLLNPWVRTEYGEANAYLKKYYKNRLVSREFWQKILSGRFNVKQSLMSFVDILTKVISKKHNKQKQQSLPDRMLQGLKDYQGQILFILSGNDLTAEEFRNLINSSDGWKSELAIKAISFKEISDANHTFASQKWRREVEEITYGWINDHMRVV